MSYNDDALPAAAAALDRLDGVVAALAAYRRDGPDDASLDESLSSTREAFEAALDDDLNISAALAAVHDLVRDVNRRIAARTISTADAGRIVAFLRDLDRVLAILDEPADGLEPALAGLLEQRAAARAAHDWAASDRLRDELAAAGIVVEDTADGQRWRRVVAVAGG